ncbi:MAG TPA: 2Fe-2S iron-sulfur cluster-binding protein [Acidimicrobiia bacterium]|nr:2Fe-2S iron-sulfur cluster-binding protein [Acidimicrobiia bacterium]
MHSVTIVPGEVVLPVDDGETLLDAILRDGFTYRFGCRRGGCTECKVALLAGEVTYDKRIAAEVFSDEERARGVCLSCRAIPESDVVIRLQDDDQLKCVSPLGSAVARQRLAAYDSRRNDPWQ